MLHIFSYNRESSAPYFKLLGILNIDKNSPVKLWFSIKPIATEIFPTPFNCWMAI